jgi:molybdopterin-guanine dinucleotide biosynthesis protein A
VHALVLAGRRGPDDPLALAAGAPHRALLELEGQPMLERVIDTLEGIPAVASIAISIDDPELIRGPAGGGLAEREAQGAIRLLQSESSPSRSVLAGLDALPRNEPILLTTADHALLDRSMVDHFLDASEKSDADLTLALVSEARIRERFPEAQRTYLPFRGERFSGANLFALRTPEARRVIEFWTRAEEFRKQPWRLVSVFGPSALILFLLRRLTLEGALERASQVIGARVRPIELPFAEAAVDVDKLADYELVKRILANRASRASLANARNSAKSAKPRDEE